MREDNVPILPAYMPKADPMYYSNDGYYHLSD